MNIKLTLRKKIMFGYGLVICLMIVVLIWSLYNLLRLGKASDLILSENYKSILAAENMIDAIERQDSGTLLMILGYDEEGLRQFRENEGQFYEWLGRAKDNITIVGEDKIIEDIDTTYTSYLIVCTNLRLLNKTEKEKAGPFYHESVLPVFRSVRHACTQLREINHQTMFEASSNTQVLATRATWSVILIGFTAVSLGLIFSIMLSSFLVKPLRKLMQATQVIAEGNYDVEVTKTSTDELGILAEEFNVMAKKLKKYHDLNIAQVVAEKRKSEAIIQSMDDGIVVVDSDFRITGINPIAARYLHIDSTKAMDRHFLEVVRSEPLFSYLKKAGETGESPIIGEGEDIISVRDKDSDRFFQFSILPVHEASGPILSIVLLLRDVTRLKELDRLKSEFVMAASHELRTPLTSISMSIELLRETVLAKLNEKEKELLSAASEEIERLKALVNDLLDLSKIEAGKMEMEFERISVGLVFDKTISVMKSQADEKAIRLDSELPENIPQVKADANKITWVLINLVANAIRYTGKGGNIHLSVRLFGNQVHISVTDDGAGIPMEYQTKIFEKFVQVKDGRESRGSGLGLSICKEIIRAHGGTIWVDSKPDKGSTFTFTLPAIDIQSKRG
ncbi:MAG: ATP-binding protein [bacterium]